MNAANLPPWGQLDEYFLKYIKTRPIPEAWQPLNGIQWTPWFNSLVSTLSANLWPTYNPDLGKWNGTPSNDLLDTDFELMKSLWPEINQPILGEPGKPLHRVFFDEEDDHTIVFGAQYERYDPAFPEHLREGKRFTQILLNGFDRKLGSLHYQLKQIFQRPRPYQVAMLQKRKDFNHMFTRLGPHPSLVSGHCLQTCLSGTSAYLLLGAGLDFASIEILKQFTVDVGDRRVFGGVHYPSDNLSSWYTAFKLLPHVVDSTALPAARSFLWDAVSDKSIVYQKIVEHTNIHGAASPYFNVVNDIRIAAGQPALSTAVAAARRARVAPSRSRASRRMRAPAKQRA
jgi:hypothetical protein